MNYKHLTRNLFNNVKFLSPTILQNTKFLKNAVNPFIIKVKIMSYSKEKPKMEILVTQNKNIRKEHFPLKKEEKP